MTVPTPPYRQPCVPVALLLSSATFIPAAPTKTYYCSCYKRCTEHNCVTIVVVYWVTHKLFPKPALFSWFAIFHPDTIFLPGLGWVGNEWYEIAMNNQASAGEIWDGTQSRTCQSASPIIRRGHCSMTGTKPFLYAGCILPAVLGAFASLRNERLGLKRSNLLKHKWPSWFTSKYTTTKKLLLGRDLVCQVSTEQNFTAKL